MSRRCRDLHAFADGELPERQRARFSAHLATCRACARELEVVLALGALAAGVASGPPEDRPPPLRQKGRGRWRWFSRLSTVAALALVACRDDARETAGAAEASFARALARPRRFEARLSDPRADRHRPYEAERGPAPAGDTPDYQTFHALAQAGDWRGLTALLLLAGENESAARHLAAHGKDPGLDNERAVLALNRGQPDEALAAVERWLGKQRTSTVGLWNRALALRELGLGGEAARAFRAVAARGEPGWAGEAAEAADALARETDARRERHRRAEEEARRLATRGTPPSPETLRGFPELVRQQLYEALRRAATAAEVAALAPITHALEPDGGPLTSERARIARLDFTRRAPLAAAYARWADAGAGAPAPIARLRRAGAIAADQLDGVLLASPAGAGDPRVLALARAGDPWLRVLALLRRGRADPDTSVGGARERALAEARAVAQAAGLTLPRLWAEDALAALFFQQQRPREAAPLVDSTWQAARAHGHWPEELRALGKRAVLYSHRRNASVVAALGDEVVGRGASCELGVELQGRVAQRATNDGRLEDARRAFALVEGCLPRAPVSLAQLSAVSELARAEPGSKYARWLVRDAARFRHEPRPDGQVLSRSDRLSADAYEGRGLIHADPTTGHRLLAHVIAEIERVPGRSREASAPRLLAYRRLISAAARADDASRALALIAGEAEVSLPAGCVLGVSEDLNRATVVARDPDGRYRLAHGHEVNASAPEAVVPARLAAALATCDEVAVIALSPFFARPRLLPRAFAFHHRVRGDAGAGWRPERRVVVSDVLAPADLHLPPLPPWQGRGGPTIARHLRGAEATPRAVLDELGRADLVELHVHGLVDASRADAPALVLSGEQLETSRLDADTVRARALPHRPLVVLAACNSAANNSYFPSQSGRWSLTRAFADAGARAVIAANIAIPDRATTALVDELVAAIARGAAPARALRDARLARPVSFVDDVVVIH